MNTHWFVLRPCCPAIVLALLLISACLKDGPTETNNNQPKAVMKADLWEVPEDDNRQTIVTLDGSDSSDPDNDPLTFLWDVVSGHPPKWAAIQG